MRRVAPVLRALMDDLWSLAHGKKPHPKASLEGDRRVIRLATAELRALLAVARAAHSVLDPDDRGEPALLPEWKRLDRALAALERLSGRGRRKGEP